MNCIKLQKKQGKEDEIPNLLGTISIGVVSYGGESEDQENVTDLIKQADVGLYVAKENGRNQVTNGVQLKKETDVINDNL